MNEEKIMPNENDIKAMFDKIATEYDFLNNIISAFMHTFVKKTAIKALNIKNDAKVLDLCTGSGDLGRIVKNISPKAEVIGVDFSKEMLDIAKKKNPDIKYFNMDATKLDFEDDFFDYVVMGFGLRNIPKNKEALAEIYRILKPGGFFMHLDFGEKTLFSKIFDKIVIFLMNIFAKEKNAYIYLINSKNNFPSPENLIQIFEKCGFYTVAIKYLLFKIISFQILKKY